MLKTVASKRYLETNGSCMTIYRGLQRGRRSATRPGPLGSLAAVDRSRGSYPTAQPSRGGEFSGNGGGSQQTTDDYLIIKYLQFMTIQGPCTYYVM